MVFILVNIGAILMLIRNFDIENELRNGISLKIVRISQNILVFGVVTGRTTGIQMILPKLDMGAH